MIRCFFSFPLFFPLSSFSLPLFLRSREFEGARRTTSSRTGQGKEKWKNKIEYSQRDRRSGSKDRRERFESGGGRKAMKSAGSTFINGASRQCRHARRTVPRVYKYISHATWFIMPTACSKSLWFTVSKLAWIRPIRWSNERRNPYPLSNRGRSLKATLSPLLFRIAKSIVASLRNPLIVIGFTPVKWIFLSMNSFTLALNFHL